MSKKIYVIHATLYNFKAELYEPLKASSLTKHYTFCFPHEDKSSNVKITMKFIQNAELILDEISYPSTGSGIELGSKCYPAQLMDC